MRKLSRGRRALHWGGFCLLLVCAAGNVRARAVWIDTDLSIGSPFREVDDAYALLLAFRSPELRVAGLSSTYGNAPLLATTRRARDLVARLDLTTPVHPGAASARDLGRASAASDALGRALRKERLTYVALGPLTNLATFFQLHPGAAKRFEQIIMVAGRSPEATLGFGPQEKFRIHDANFVKDPAAIRIVLKARVPILLTPIETSSLILLTAEDLRTLRASGPVGRFVADKSSWWLWFWRNIARARGGPIFDALAVVAAARPALLTTETRYLSSEDGDLIAHREPGPARRKVEFCSGFAPITKGFVIRRLNAQRAKSSSARPAQ